MEWTFRVLYKIFPLTNQVWNLGIRFQNNYKYLTLAVWFENVFDFKEFHFPQKQLGCYWVDWQRFRMSFVKRLFIWFTEGKVCTKAGPRCQEGTICIEGTCASDCPCNEEAGEVCEGAECKVTGMCYTYSFWVKKNQMSIWIHKEDRCENSSWSN